MRQANTQSSHLLVALFALLALLVASPAFAYLDPGTGSMILQIILGGVAGILIAGKLYWTRLKEFFGLNADQNSSGEDTTDANLD